MKISFALMLGILTTAFGCGTTPTAFGGTLNIDSPTDHSAVNVGLVDKNVAVNFTTNFTLKAPGQCAGINACGHVLLLIDSSACNANGQPENAIAVASPTNVNFALCAMPTGAHTITAELRDDNDNVVTTSLTGNPVTSTVNVTVQ